MSFVIYDLVFLTLFTVVTVLFLYRKRANLKRQGILYLYRTSLGLKAIEWTSTKFEKILKPLQYVIIGVGYVLMASMIWLLAKFTYTYSVSSLFVEATKIPPVLPLVPYLPELFKVDYLPSFYFTYWIVIIAVIAISHEFAHGIFARLNKIKVKSTGFGFLGPFLAAFVEPDEKQMAKAKKFPQLSILAAGVFANIIMAILFGAIMILFFNGFFAPSGIVFNAYPTTLIETNSIDSVEGVLFSELNSLESEKRFVELSADGKTYLAPLTHLKETVAKNKEEIIVYLDAPAIREGIDGPILAIDGVSIKSRAELSTILDSYKPGDRIVVTSIDDEVRKDYDVVLGENDGEAFLGVGFREPSKKGISGLISGLLAKAKDPSIYYEPSTGGDFSWFVYNLLWWIVLANISVALVNMLPMGIFDGGRFFYLTVLGITKSEKFAKKAFSFATWLILAIFVWLMVRWSFVFFT